MEKKQAFKALSKICLNNWHYIDKKILTFSEGINFFTGHSGSGKSTVIDALQIVLYANTDGRGFFNKAAADDSDRSLIEYLRGMVNISDNNESEYLRNKNFSSTIVLEFTNSYTREQECAGVVFDVETATNEINRLFFWHRGAVLPNGYRGEGRVLTTLEIREYLQRNFTQENFYCGPSNERFRRQLYDIYLGGLDMEKFPRLFKRAIPFRMNIKLEDFVKEYICMEQDIEIEDMQESVMQYGRMQSKIETTLKEISELKKIQENYDAFREIRMQEDSYAYRVKRLEILKLKQELEETAVKKEETKAELSKQEIMAEDMEKSIAGIQKQYEEVIVKIAQTGYEELMDKLKNLNVLMEHLGNSAAGFHTAAERLKEWKEEEIVSNQVANDIDKFLKQTITEGELERLKEELAFIHEDIEEERQENSQELKAVKKQIKAADEELLELKQGKKAYPRELEEARYYIRSELQKRAGKFVNVRILADLLEVKDETWHNAVEGYLDHNKTVLIVEPEYAREAMSIYQEMDKKKYHRVAVIDTEKLMETEHVVRPGALAEEVRAKEDYVQAYVDFVLGNVIKCSNIDELREQRIGITPDCMLYHSYRLKFINPESYTRRAYIGENSLKKRRSELMQTRQELENQKIPLEEAVADNRRILSMEYLERPVNEYLNMQKSIRTLRDKEKEKEKIIEQLQKLKDENVGSLEKEKAELKERQNEKEKLLENIRQGIWERNSSLKEADNHYLIVSEELTEKEKSFEENELFAETFGKYMESRKTSNYDYLKKICYSEQMSCARQREQRYQTLVDVRSAYIRNYPHRTFSTSTEDNGPYEKLLTKLECDHLEEYREKANEQAKAAIQHFKEDFIYKIRSAIKEAYQRRDELNRIISRLDFGKDKYQFVITKNKGPDGEYYKMFMDDSLEINPAKLTNSIDHQMDLFSMEHEERYGEMVNELIHIFIPPEHATLEEMEEAKRNMAKYADYRTYLSFDMQQIIKGETNMHIGLSKMIKKNSGGEGQNPLYVALLASFAQVYRLNLSPKVRRSPTIRLVVLDEAFSKMDAEKVASCIELIRGLGFQAIISATNDKIQNYLENVDKTFVYANPDKRSISIMEFEKEDFEQLVTEDEDVEPDEMVLD